MFILKKILCFVLIVVMSLLCISYVILQTHWGCKQISRMISDYTPYYLSIGEITYKLNQPTRLALSHVIFGYDGYPALAMAKNVRFKLQLGKYLLPTFANISANQVIFAPANLPIKPSFPAISSVLTLKDVQVLAGKNTPKFLANTVKMKFQQQANNTNMLYHLQASDIVFREREFNLVKAEGKITRNHLLVSCIAGQLSLGELSGNLKYSFKYGLQKQNITFKYFGDNEKDHLLF